MNKVMKEVILVVFVLTLVSACGGGGSDSGGGGDFNECTPSIVRPGSDVGVFNFAENNGPGTLKATFFRDNTVILIFDGKVKTAPIPWSYTGGIDGGHRNAKQITLQSVSGSLVFDIFYEHTREPTTCFITRMDANVSGTLFTGNRAN